MSKIIASAEAENQGQNYETQITAGRHQFVADELPELGGQDLGPDPFNYLCGALASCTVITLRMYVQRKGWDVQNIKAQVKLEKESDDVSGNHTYQTTISFSGNLNDEQRDRLLYIAKACPIHRLMSKAGEIRTEIG